MARFQASDLFKALIVRRNPPTATKSYSVQHTASSISGFYRCYEPSSLCLLSPSFLDQGSAMRGGRCVSLPRKGCLYSISRKVPAPRWDQTLRRHLASWPRNLVHTGEDQPAAGVRWVGRSEASA